MFTVLAFGFGERALHRNLKPYECESIFHSIIVSILDTSTCFQYSEGQSNCDHVFMCGIVIFTNFSRSRYYSFIPLEYAERVKDNSSETLFTVQHWVPDIIHNSIVWHWVLCDGY